MVLRVNGGEHNKNTVFFILYSASRSRSRGRRERRSGCVCSAVNTDFRVIQRESAYFGIEKLRTQNCARCHLVEEQKYAPRLPPAELCSSNQIS